MNNNAQIAPLNTTSVIDVCIAIFAGITMITMTLLGY